MCTSVLVSWRLEALNTVKLKLEIVVSYLIWVLETELRPSRTAASDINSCAILRNTTFRYISKGCSIIPQGHVLNYVLAALFVIARTWKQPKCPLTEEWMKKMWYIYTMEYYTAAKMDGWEA